MSPERDERIWYARMVGRSALGGALALELVLPLLEGASAFNMVLAAFGVCLAVSLMATLILERLERS